MIGQILNQRYEILEKIGDGGMAEVYRAHCHVLHRSVAIKVLKNQFSGDEEFIRKFRKESAAAAALNHPNIINVYDVGEEVVAGKIIYYIVMEYVNGITLKELIQARGRLSSEKTVFYGEQVARALNHAHHHHIIHRDIKPQNIMITKDDVVKVMDFGIARMTTSQTMTIAKEAMGSVHYTSPEQAKGQLTDEKSDIYSLGIVLYEMVTGTLPFDGDTPVTVGLKHIQGNFIAPSHFAPDIKPGLEQLIIKCMKLNPSDRYNNTDELLSDFHRIKEGLSLENAEDTFQTQVLPQEEIRIASKKTAGAKAPTKKSKKKSVNRKAQKKKDIKMTVLGVVLAFLVVMGAFLGFKKLLFGPGGRGADVQVPEIIGLDESEARDLCKKEGLVLEIESIVQNDEYEEGQIVSINNTAEGNTVRKGFTVKVSVNGSEESIIVPNVMGLSQQRAIKLLEDEGLVVGELKAEASEEVDKDEVISQHPQAKEKVPKGTRVDLLISSGPEETVFMPNLLDVNVNKAKKTLENLGLHAEIKYEESDQYDRDQVCWQEIPKGTEIEKDTTVLLYVSSGKVETPEEPIVSEREPMSKTYTITPDPSREYYKLTIYRDSPDGIEVVFERNIYYNDETEKVTLNGFVGDSFKVYEDDVLVQEIR